MKALVYEGKEKIVVREVAFPKEKPGYINLKIKYCGICGSDLGIFFGTHPRAKAPLILGHEFIGTACSDSASGDIHMGDRVTAFPLLPCGTCRSCRTGKEHICQNFGMLGIDRDGGIAEYISVPENSLVKLPDELSDLAATLIEPLAVIIRTVHQSGLKAFGTAAVIGAGPIGLLTGIVLRHIGVEHILISDLNSTRLKKAEKLGLIPVWATDDKLLQKVNILTRGYGVDVAFECSGSQAGAQTMTQVVRPGGNICMTAVHKVPHPVDLREINFKELQVIGSRVYTRQEFLQATIYAVNIQPELEQLVSDVLPLGRSAEAFSRILETNSTSIKVLVDCSKGDD